MVTKFESLPGETSRKTRTSWILINDFQKKNPKIKVELLRIPFSEYVTKLLTQIASGLAPDVIFVEVNNFVDLYLRGAFEPLNPYIQADHLNLGAYYPEVVDRFTVKNQTYIIPRDTAPIGVIYYNKKAFDEAKCLIPRTIGLGPISSPSARRS